MRRVAMAADDEEDPEREGNGPVARKRCVSDDKRVGKASRGRSSGEAKEAKRESRNKPTANKSRAVVDAPQAVGKGVT